MKTPYITAEGEKALRDELQFLWKVRRPEVTRAVSEAAALGDRSENAEYIYGKKQLREIDRRVRFLSRRLEEVRVVATPPEDRSRIFFGAWVELESEEGDILRYRLVGVDEFDLTRGYLSIDAPLARAMLKKTAGDEVVFQAPEGQKRLTVLSVSYQAPIS